MKHLPHGSVAERRHSVPAFAVGLGAPTALALVAGRALADEGPSTFNLPAAVVAGALAVAAGTAVLMTALRPGRASLARPVPDDRDPSEAPAELGIGSHVQVRTHFTAGGGYVANGPMLLWATAPRERPEDFTPGTECVVVNVEREALAVASLPTEGGPR